MIKITKYMKKCIIFAYILFFLRVTKEDDPPEPEDNNFIDWAYSNMTEFIQQRILYTRCSQAFFRF